MNSNEDVDVTKHFVLPTDSLGKTIKSLRRATLSIPNRLRSIVEDAEFVQSVADAYELPLVANERCGSWYVPPTRRVASVYFKSTDGHADQWAFSLRRFNLQLLDVAARYGGVVLVDSTRRGKSMPDAFSKTVPIWCAVINRVLFPSAFDFHQLLTPPRCVSQSEHEQIEARLESFAGSLAALQLDIANLSLKGRKPFRPLWVTRESTLPMAPPTFEDFYPVILCTASRKVTEGDISADGYIQGAGDDNEGWSGGLSADVFWQNHRSLLSLSDADVIKSVEALVTAQKHHGDSTLRRNVLLRPTAWLYIGSEQITIAQLTEQEWSVVQCSQEPDLPKQAALKSRYVHLRCRDGKLGSRDLRQELDKIRPLFLDDFQGKLLVCSSEHQDLAFGVALAAFCLKDARTLHRSIDKDFIRQRLGWISTELPEARPLRATLQSVNDCLMSTEHRPVHSGTQSP